MDLLCLNMSHILCLVQSCGGARLRRKRRRAAEKRQAEETVKNKAEKADLENVQVVTTAIVNEVTDEVS